MVWQMHPVRDETGSVFWAVLAVLLAVSLLFSSVVFYGIWHHAQNRRFLYRQQAKYLNLAAVENTRYQLNNLLAFNTDPEDLGLGDSLSGRRNWTSEISSWGCFWRAISRGKSHQEPWTTDLLLGRDPRAIDQYAIRLFGPPYPLVLAGTTKIFGDVCLGPGGVTSGRYKGRSHLDSILVHGDIVTESRPTRPEFDWTVWEDFQSRIESIRRNASTRSDRTLIIDDSFSPSAEDSIIIIDGKVTITRQQPLETAKPVYLLATDEITITASTRLDGRWAVISSRRIRVANRACLAGVVLYAPHIILTDDVIFSGQAIADTLIEVQGQSRTIFPTVLWVRGDKRAISGSRIDLGSTRKCEGIALATLPAGQWIGPFEREGAGELLLRPGSLWVGYLYADGRAQIQGSVAGSIAANMLCLNDPPTTYLNWLVDVRINRHAWAGQAGLPAIFAGEAPWVIAEHDRPGKDVLSKTREPQGLVGD